MILGVLNACFFIALPGIANPETIVDSNITLDTTWTRVGSPYNVAQGVVVNPGVRLKIDPGVEVNLNSVFKIHGELIAEGTEDEGIIFTSGGIVFETDAVPSTWDNQGKYLSGSIIKYCEIRNGSGVSTQIDLDISENILESNSRGIINSGNSRIENNKILNNSIGYPGGTGSHFISGVGITNSGNSIIRGNKVDGNYGLCENYYQLDYCYGCGIYNEGNSVVIEDNSITNNILEGNHSDVTAYGAAIYNIGDSVTIKGNTIRDNATRGLGGSLGGICAGIYNLGESLNIEHNHILCNHGYGIWIEANNCKIKTNDLKNGIRIESSDSTMIKGNTITAISIFCQYSTNTLIESNTFLENAFILNDTSGAGENDRTWIIKGNSFTGNNLYTAIRNTQHAIIKSNIIRGYVDGIVNQGKATIENNEVSDNSHYGISTSVMLESFFGNNLFNNFEYDFHYTATVDQTAISNYWGTTNSSEIMDNIYDYWDDITFGKVIFEPFAVTPFTIDSDNDGLPDIIENNSCTDAFNADSDIDGIKDGVEDANHNGTFDSGETNPCNRDTDNDGMTDGWEVQYNLNPMVDDASEDADGDGYTNIEEYRGLSDPRDDNSLPKPKSMPWIPLLLLDG